jgi:hypothetical protein
VNRARYRSGALALREFGFIREGAAEEAAGAGAWAEAARQQARSSIEDLIRPHFTVSGTCLFVLGVKRR